MLGVLAGAETIVDIARFGEKKRELLRRFRPFRDGTPRTTTSAGATKRCNLPASAPNQTEDTPSVWFG